MKPVMIARKAFLQLSIKDRRKLLKQCCTPELVQHYEVTCPECGNYYAGHATGAGDICTCESGAKK